MRDNLYNEQIDLNIEVDPSTRLPLISEESNILSLVMNYLTLPYSVSEYGCGNKANLIIKKLIDLGLPAYTLSRGMIMERDMSENALKQYNFMKRKHALTIENVLYHKVDFEEEILFKMLEEEDIRFDERNEIINTGQYQLSHEKTLQFINARSHIFVIVAYWDEKANKVRERVVDPTLDTDECFLISQMRKYLQASEGLIFRAPLLGHFKLEEKYLTEDQHKHVKSLLSGKKLGELTWDEHRELVLGLTNADELSIADPVEWTYANNISSTTTELTYYQRVLTGEGEPLRGMFESMITHRMNRFDDGVIGMVQEMDRKIEELNLKNTVWKDAKWSEEDLEPLTRFTKTLSNHIALRELSERLSAGEDLSDSLTEPFGLDHIHGIGFRLRHRIDDLASVSIDDKGQIDARALNERYISASVECIRQMNAAGLKVFIDRVGNIHGLLIDEDSAARVSADSEEMRSLCASAICHCSHIDTVLDGGIYDGRLGVMSGIEISEILHDLHRFYDRPTVYPAVERPLLVTAFVGEEMTFTGEGVSMPGSAAVTGAADPEQVYKMVNSEGETYKSGLTAMLAEILVESDKGNIEVCIPRENGSAVTQLLNKLPEPTCFYTPHTYERHIEQGNLLDKAGVPLVLVNTIMGIHQEDVILEGTYSEEAAARINLAMRRLVQSEEFRSLRVTAGIISGSEPADHPEQLDYGYRWTLVGRKDHAGSALLQDRADAGIAIARLVNFFMDQVETHNQGSGENLRPLVGGIEVYPGTNRNVIPEMGRITLGLQQKSMKDRDFKEFSRQIHYELIKYVTGELFLPVQVGGEAVNQYHCNEVNYLNHCARVILSMDLRSDSSAKLKEFKEAISRRREEICEELSIEHEVIIEQEMKHYALEETGQVLQLERSYGGSHNPNETELSRDLLLGTILQLHTSLLFIDENESVNLHKRVGGYIPEKWKEKLNHFISGALHDTCNISQKVNMESAATEVKP